MQLQRTGSGTETTGTFPRQKLTSPDEAVATIRSGERVFLGSACATPRTLIRALEDPKNYLAGVRLYHFLTDGAIVQLGGKPWTRFQHKVFFVGTDIREIIKQGKAEYIPISVAQVPRLIENGRISIDTALIQVSPPDRDGNVSLGVSVDITRIAALRARRVIAEINPHMPRTHGESTIPLEKIDLLVPVDTPVIEYLHKKADAVARQIARYVARIVEDGSTLQVGLGQIPNEMLKYLTNRRNLGIHSDVITEPVVDLIERGVITGREKTVHPGKVVCSYCMGTRRLYDLVNDNPMFAFHPIDYVSDPAIIAAQRKMVSVTQAFAVDLTGQVCADQFAGELYSGVSTQPEFLRGAAARGGKAILCLASTTEDGRESRIRPVLQENEGVTIARSDVHFVVTEYGYAYLFGKSIRERAVSLIEIAHPSFRPWLLEEAKRLGYVSPEQIMRSRRDYPTELERWVQVGNGQRIHLRPARASDVERLQDLFYNMSHEDIYTRFFTNLKSLSVKNAQHLCNVGYRDEMAMLAVVGDDEEERVVASACYYVDPSTNMASVAYMTRPDWQGLGVGTELQKHLMACARSRGLRGFSLDVLSRNKSMLRLVHRSGCRISKRSGDGIYEIKMYFDEPGDAGAPAPSSK